MAANKRKAIERLQKALNTILHLKTLQSGSPDFEKWHRNTQVAIANTFGETARHMKDFTDVRYSPTVWSPDSPDSYFESAYQSGLDSATSVLLSMVEEVEEYWDDDPPSPELSEEPTVNVEPANPEIASGLEKFRVDYPTEKTAFIMMQFTQSRVHQEVVRVLKKTFGAHKITAFRADDKQYMDDLFPNVKTYMHACAFGIAIFERVMADDFNPNVSLEVGYMLGMGKNVLLLKDRTLKALPTDLTGRLYREFDTLDVEGTLPHEVSKWLLDKGIVKPKGNKAEV